MPNAILKYYIRRISNYIKRLAAIRGSYTWIIQGTQ